MCICRSGTLLLGRYISVVRFVHDTHGAAGRGMCSLSWRLSSRYYALSRST